MSEEKVKHIRLIEAKLGDLRAAQARETAALAIEDELQEVIVRATKRISQVRQDRAVAKVNIDKLRNEIDMLFRLAKGEIG